MIMDEELPSTGEQIEEQLSLILSVKLRSSYVNQWKNDRRQGNCFRHWEWNYRILTLLKRSKFIEKRQTETADSEKHGMQLGVLESTEERQSEAVEEQQQLRLWDAMQYTEIESSWPMHALFLISLYASVAAFPHVRIVSVCVSKSILCGLQHAELPLVPVSYTHLTLPTIYSV